MFSTVFKMLKNFFKRPIANVEPTAQNVKKNEVTRLKGLHFDNCFKPSYKVTKWWTDPRKWVVNLKKSLLIKENNQIKGVVRITKIGVHTSGKTADPKKKRRTHTKNGSKINIWLWKEGKKVDIEGKGTKRGYLERWPQIRGLLGRFAFAFATAAGFWALRRASTCVVLHCCLLLCEWPRSQGGKD